MKRLLITAAVPVTFMAVCMYFAKTQDIQTKIRQETIDAECSSGMNSVYHARDRVTRNPSAFEVKAKAEMAARFDRLLPLATVSRNVF